MLHKERNKGEDKIIVRGARTHNLKNITVEMPRNKMVVMTGLSGSGKSSLAFDTIFAEGQRRYVESLSAYARQFLNQMQKPDVDEIIGLSPAISIDQKSHSSNPRSTVATITEIYDYLRVLFARVGVPHCLTCGKPIKRLTNEEINNFIVERVDHIGAHESKDEVMGVTYSTLKVGIYAPVVRGRKGEYYQLLYDLLSKGYSKVRIDGKIKNLRDRIELTKTKKHDIDILVDEFFVSEFKEKQKGVHERLSESVEKALEETDGLVLLVFGEEETLMSAKFACPDDGFSYPEIEPRLFSFNSPYGACSSCNGLGTKHFFGDDPCDVCKGARLREEALNVTVGDANAIEEAKRSKKKNKVLYPRGKSILEITDMSIAEASDFFTMLELTPMEQQISSVIIKEIESRLRFMLDVGIGYLTLGRRAPARTQTCPGPPGPMSGRPRTTAL